MSLSLDATAQYFDHDADIGIIGRGATLEQAFMDAARVVFALMGDLSKVSRQETITFEFTEEDIELALVTWLNLLIANAAAKLLLFSDFELRHEGDHWYASASGQKWHDGMERGIEVKGATLTMLSVKQTEKGYEAKCVVDV